MQRRIYKWDNKTQKKKQEKQQKEQQNTTELDRNEWSAEFQEQNQRSSSDIYK